MNGELPAIEMYLSPSMCDQHKCDAQDAGISWDEVLELDFNYKGEWFHVKVEWSYV